jgi:NAD(P)-dependent dehydrogenase (short-subunit alcohol dehydrogenase family)
MFNKLATMKTKKQTLIFLGAAAAAFLALRAVKRQTSAYSFRGKVVVITGGSRGLGLVLARQLAAEGAKLAICSRTADKLEEAREELKSQSATVYAKVCDVTDMSQLEAFLAGVTRNVGPVDVLINNAGIIQAGPLEAMRLDDFEKAMNTHFWAPLYGMMAVIPSMKARGEGRIVNIASLGGKVSVPHIVPYSASKFALEGLSTGFQRELKKDGIVVTTVNPGLFRSGSVYNIGVKGQTQKEFAWFTTLASNLLTSSSVEETARRILDGCRYGEAEVITNLPARFLTVFNTVFPELTAELMSLTSEYVLPDPVSSPREEKGSESDSDLIPEHLRERAAEAAAKNNEL